MASVDGMTVAALNRELDKMIVRIEVDPDTSTILAYPRNGDPIDAGPIVDSSIAVANAWPIGSIYITAAAGGVNPHTLLGIGTWERWGKGKTIVSLNEAETEFDGLEETGGVKAVTLTAAQSGLPTHGHTVSGSGSTSSVAPDANFTNEVASTNPTTPGAIHRGASSGRVRASLDNGEHIHAFSFSATTSAAGGSDAAAAHTNLSPYIVAYVWKRTA